MDSYRHKLHKYLDFSTYLLEFLVVKGVEGTSHKLQLEIVSLTFCDIVLSLPKVAELRYKHKEYLEKVCLIMSNELNSYDISHAEPEKLHSRGQILHG
jgi:hypothetical protein